MLTLALLTALFPAPATRAAAQVTGLSDTTHRLTVHDDYAPGKALVLLGIEGTPATVTCDGQTMLDVTSANYKLDGKRYTHTYAIVVDESAAATAQVAAEPVDSNQAANAKAILSNLLHYDCDVDRSGSVNIRDAQTVACIMNGGTPSTADDMKTWLLADADANGTVNTSDILAILTAAHR